MQEGLYARTYLQNLNHLLDAKTSLFTSQHKLLDCGHDGSFDGSLLRSQSARRNQARESLLCHKDCQKLQPVRESSCWGHSTIEVVHIIPFIFLCGMAVGDPICYRPAPAKLSYRG